MLYFDFVSVLSASLSLDVQKKSLDYSNAPQEYSMPSSIDCLLLRHSSTDSLDQEVVRYELKSPRS